ncbi:PAS domain S-box protein, partial [Candidatus Gracilibacteria bacterium]|nr:PAS domain S-box protein [Candidatus Gracilibacteria bacterium]
EEKDVLGKNINFLIPHDLRESNKILIHELEDKKYIRNYETQRLDRSGNRIDLYLSITKVIDGNNDFIGFLLIYQDISEQKRINTELQKRFEAIQDAYKELGLQKRQNDYLFEIAEMATSQNPIESLEKLIVSAICMLTKCDGVVLRRYDGKRKTLKLKSCLGVSQKWWDKNQIKYKNSLAEEAMKRKRAIILDNISSNPKHSGQKLLKSHKFTTMIQLPLFIQNKLLGSLSLYVTNPAKLRFIETDFLDKFSKQCSLAIKAKIG